MKKAIKNVYKFSVQCDVCNKSKTVLYTVSDFGDAPHLMRCKYCEELYWYTPEDEAYIKPIEKQLIDLKCVKCGSKLKDSLVPTHKDINCFGTVFSLDDDFTGNAIPPNSDMISVDVYLLYS